MLSIFIVTIISVIIVSLISFIGIFTLSLNYKKLQKILIYLISFSAGTLLGDVFIHLLPELAESSFTLKTSLYILGGIGIFFILEKFVHWDHCHGHILDDKHIHPFAYTNLIGDGLHNFLDGLIIAGSFLISIPTGIATTIAVVAHEIPQEIGDFGILIHAGFTKSKALFINFASGLIAVFGALIALVLSNSIDNIETILTPIAIGGFIYIAGSDLIPEIHKTTDAKKSLLQLVALIVGVAIMASLLLLE